MFRTKSVILQSTRGKTGLRILVARLRGRGLSKNRYHIWMASLGPTEKLLRDFQKGRITWAEFTSHYRHELFEGGTIDQRNRTIKNHGQKFTLRLLQLLARQGPVTLMCH